MNGEQEIYDVCLSVPLTLRVLAHDLQSAKLAADRACTKATLIMVITDELQAYSIGFPEHITAELAEEVIA